MNSAKPEAWKSISRWLSPALRDDTTGKGSQAAAPRQGCQNSATPAGVGFPGMTSGGGVRRCGLTTGIRHNDVSPRQG